MVSGPGARRPWRSKREMILRGGPTELNWKALQTNSLEVRDQSEIYLVLPPPTNHYQIRLPVQQCGPCSHPLPGEHNPKFLSSYSFPACHWLCSGPPTSLTPPRPTSNGPCLPSQALAPPSAEVLLGRFPVLKLLLNPVYTYLYSLKSSVPSKCLSGTT